MRSYILRLLLKDHFPQIWVPSWENRDLRQLLWHRHRMVQARTRIMNQLQAVALNEGLRCKKRLWREAGREQLEAFRVSSVGEPATARSAGVAGSTEPDDRGADAGDRAGSGEVSRGAALDDASRGGCADGIGLRADHRESGAVSVWQADRELSGTGAVGGLERESATAGAYHANKATRCCVSCWWKRPRSRCAACRNGAASTFTWRCGGDGRSPRSPWPGDWRFVCYWMRRKGWDYEQVKKFGSHAGQPGNRHGVQ